MSQHEITDELKGHGVTGEGITDNVLIDNVKTRLLVGQALNETDRENKT